MMTCQIPPALGRVVFNFNLRQGTETPRYHRLYAAWFSVSALVAISSLHLLRNNKAETESPRGIKGIAKGKHDVRPRRKLKHHTA
jgi:hypothetical protein